MEILQVHHLTKRFNRLLAVDQLSLEVEKGNIYGILGPNGSGKSTTLGMLLGVTNPTSGDWKWFGEEPSHEIRRKKIGATIEHPNFYPYLSGYKNLRISALIKDIDPAKVDEKLEWVGLADRKHDAYKTYSLGMKQRLAIASALLSDPEVLILDEPTNGLDPSGIIQVRNMIREIGEMGTTILIASHLLDEIEKICTHVIVLQKGKTLYQGPIDEMTASKGYFIVDAADRQSLIDVLSKSSHFYSVTEKENKVWAYIEEDISQVELNTLLFEKGIVLSHLEKRKENLESQFLQLTEKPSA